VVPQWRRAWGRVEALQAGGCGVGEGLTFWWGIPFSP